MGETVEGKPGDTVELNFNVVDPNNSQLPISGAQFIITVDGENFVITGATGSDAYTAAIEPHDATGEYAFANGVGNAVASEDGKSVIKLSITIPEGAAEGEYTVDMHDHLVTDLNAQDITDKVLVLDGKIIVKPINPEKTVVRTYAVLESVPGFYFSHDDGSTRGRGFSLGQLKLDTFKLVDVYDDGTEEERADVDTTLLNYNGKTPAGVYDEARTDFTYDHDVQVYYGDTALVDKDGNPMYITAYIGVKGDINLDNKVTAVDASYALVYYADLSAGADGQEVDPNTVLLSRSPLVSGPDSIMDQFAAFLGDVNEDEYSADNWSKTKAQRKIIAVDASLILVYYAELNDLVNQYAPDEVPESAKQELWDKVCPDRNSSK